MGFTFSLGHGEFLCVQILLRLTQLLQILQNQNQRDSAVLELYDAMTSTFRVASKEDVLLRHSEFKETFHSMLTQTVECSIFISGYAHQSYLREVLWVIIFRPY